MGSIDTYALNNGASFSIAPGWGCNMFSWIVDGVELMYCPVNYPEAASKLTGGGNPLLFPSIGRTWDRSSGQPVPGNYQIYGSDKTYFMPSHGILFLCEFRKIGEECSAERASASYELVVPESVRSENYPFDLGFVQNYSLTGAKIELESVITNKGDVPAPAAFGHHPYFRISNPQREGVEVRIPMKKHLFVTKDTVLLTGEWEKTDGITKMQEGIYYDNVFSDNVGQRMSLMDRRAGRAIHVDFDKKCELFLLYSPDGSDFVCIEPWSRLGAYEYLKEPGWESGKLIPVLQPGESVTYRATFSVEAGVD